MALGTATKSSEVLTMGTFNPTEMVEAGGLRASKFWGKIVLSRIRPAEAGKNAKEPYGCYWELHIQPDDPETPLQTPRYRIGSLRNYCPSKDNKTPAGGNKQTFIMLADGRAKLEGDKDVEMLSGPYFARLSDDGPQKTKGTNFEQLLTKFFALGVEIKNAESVVGLYCFWDEFIPEGRENLNQGQGQNNAPMWILVPTELGEKKSVKAVGSKTKATTTTTKNEEPEDEEEQEEEETQSASEEEESEEGEEEESPTTKSDSDEDIDELIAREIVKKGKSNTKKAVKLDDVPALLMLVPQKRQAEAIKYWTASKEELYEGGEVAGLWKWNRDKGTLIVA